MSVRVTLNFNILYMMCRDSKIEPRLYGGHYNGSTDLTTLHISLRIIEVLVLGKGVYRKESKNYGIKKRKQ